MAERTRFNSKGALIPSNYGLRKAGPSTYECEGCGREFSAHGTYQPYSWAIDGPRTYALNKARAQRHADTCNGGAA